MSDALHNLPNRLSEVRSFANLSQSELGKKLGVSTSLISHWEKGTRTPSESQLMALAQHMGVALDYLLNATIRPRFQFRALATSPQRDEIEHALLDASMQVHFVDTAWRLAKKAPAPFSLRADFDSFDALPNITSHLRDTLKLNRRVTLDELKQALSEWKIFVYRHLHQFRAHPHPPALHPRARIRSRRLSLGT
jgi:transcriptional regulator with XRE-family HTH domain